MQTLQAWPKELARVMRPVAQLINGPTLPTLTQWDRTARNYGWSDRHAFAQASYVQTLFANRADFTALASFTAEASILAMAANPDQPLIEAGYFQGNKGFGRAIRIEAEGIIASTGTPTYIFQVRLGTTSGSAYLSGTSVGVTAAITMASGVSNKWWKLILDLECNTPGIGTGNTTLSGAGCVMSPGGFASPFIYALEPTTPDTATWTSTLDGSLTQYVNISLTCSANSASNTCTCKLLRLFSLN